MSHPRFRFQVLDSMLSLSHCRFQVVDFTVVNDAMMVTNRLEEDRATTYWIKRGRLFRGTNLGTCRREKRLTGHSISFNVKHLKTFYIFAPNYNEHIFNEYISNRCLIKHDNFLSCKLVGSRVRVNEKWNRKIMEWSKNSKNKIIDESSAINNDKN